MKKILILLFLLAAFFVCACGSTSRVSKYGNNPQNQKMPVLPSPVENTAMN